MSESPNVGLLEEEEGGGSSLVDGQGGGTPVGSQYTLPRLHIGSSLDIGRSTPQDRNVVDEKKGSTLLPHQTVTTGTVAIDHEEYHDALKVSVPHLGSAYVRMTLTGVHKQGATARPSIFVGDLLISNPMGDEVGDGNGMVRMSRILQSPADDDGNSPDVWDVATEIDRNVAHGGDWVFTIRVKRAGPASSDGLDVATVVATVEGTFRDATIIAEPVPSSLAPPA